MSVHDAATQILALHKRHAKEVGDVITKGIQDHARDISDGKVPSTSLLILALPDEYKRPCATRRLVASRWKSCLGSGAHRTQYRVLGSLSVTKVLSVDREVVGRKPKG